MLQSTVMTLPQRATAVAGAAAVASAVVVLPPVAAPRLASTVDVVVVDTQVALTTAESAALPDGFDLTSIDPAMLATIDPAMLVAPAYDEAIAGIPDMSTIVDELTQQAADPAAYVSLVFNPFQFVFGMLHYLWWPVQEIERLISGMWGML